MTDFTEQSPVEGLRFDSKGLIPCVMQDARNGEVLTLAYMNLESFKRTMQTGLVTFYSRSRKQLWTKGESSGNTMRVAELKLDCDGDALVASVLPEGPACHTGEPDCFFQTVFKNKAVLSEVEALPAPAGWGAGFGQLLEDVRTLLQERRTRMPEGSYSTYLFTQGLDKILKKLGEEAVETVIAAKGDDRNALAGEMVDLLFHMLVLMVHKEISLEDLRRVMHARHRKDDEKTLKTGVISASEVRVSRPAGCDVLETRLLTQLAPELHRDVMRALEIMYRAHKGQMREEGVPYATHPLSVALIAVEEVKLRGRDEIIATLLHDVLEDDMETKPDELSQKFGDELTGAVVTLTKMYKRDGTPKELGLQRYYQGLRAAPIWVKVVKICDRIHNLRTLKASGRSDEQIAQYKKESRERLLPLAATGIDQRLLKAGDLLLQELYK